MRIAGHDVPVSNPDKLFFPAAGLTKGDLVAYYLGVAELRSPPPAPAAVPHEAVPERRRERLLPPEARAREASRLRRRGVRLVPERPLDGLRDRRQRGGARLGREPRLHRAAHLALARARDRAAGLPADRPRPDERRPVAVRARDRARRARGDGRARARSYPKTSGATGLHILAPIQPELPFPEVRRFAKALAEEVERRVGDQAVATTTWRVADRVGVFVDFGQNARDRTIASRLLGAPDAGRARVGAAALGRGRRRRSRRVHASRRCAARIAAVGDPMRGMWRSAALACAALREARARPAGLTDSEERLDAGARRGRAPAAARARCSRADPCRRASGSASCRGGSGCPAPCRSAPRRRAPAARAPPRARRVPQRFGSETCQSGVVLDERQHASPRPRPACFAATAHEPT